MKHTLEISGAKKNCNGSYPTIQAAASIVYSFDDWLVASGRPSPTFGEKQPGTKSVGITTLVELGQHSLASVQSLFQSCYWLPLTTSDKLIDNVSDCLLRYVRALNASAPIPQNDYRIAEAMVCAHAEAIRWHLLGHRDIPEDVREGLSSCLTGIDHTRYACRAATATYIEAVVLMALKPDSLRRPEVIAVASDVAQWAKTLTPSATPIDHNENMAIDIAQCAMKRHVTGEPEGPAFYIRRSDLHSLLETFQYHAIGTKPNTHYQRWLTRAIWRLHYESGIDRSAARVTVQRECTVHINYLPILEKLQASSDGGSQIACTWGGVVRDQTDHGCKLTLNIPDDRRLTVGALILLSIDRIEADRIGVIRWLQYSEDRRSADAGIEFFSGTARIDDPTKESGCHPLHRLPEHGIVAGYNSPTTLTAISLIQPAVSSHRTKIVHLGNKLHMPPQATVMETGVDFKLVSYLE